MRNVIREDSVTALLQQEWKKRSQKPVTDPLQSWSSVVPWVRTERNDVEEGQGRKFRSLFMKAHNGKKYF